MRTAKKRSAGLGVGLASLCLASFALASCRAQRPAGPDATRAPASPPELRTLVHVVDEADRRPLAGAEIATTDVVGRAGEGEGGRPRERRTRVVTDADGFAELHTRSGGAPRSEVALDGYGPLCFTPEAGHGTRENALVVPLRRAARVAGRVVTAPGEDAAGLVVRLSADTLDLQLDTGARDHVTFWLDSDDEREWRAPVTADGGFAQDGLPAGVPLTAEVLRGEELLRKERDPLVLQPGEARDVLFDLGEACTLLGTVVDQDGAPVPHADLWLVAGPPLGYFEDDEVWAETSSDADGRFSFERLKPGAWSVGPAPVEGDEDPGGLLAPLPVEVDLAAGDEELRLQAWRGLCVRGRLTGPDGETLDEALRGKVGADGEPADPSSGSIWASGDGGEVLAQVDGDEFTIGPLAPGAVQVTATDFPGYADSEPLEAQAGDAGVVLRLRRGGVLAGHVVDAATGAPAEALLLAVSAEPPGQASAWSEGGSFRLAAVTPGAEQLFAVTEDGRVGLARDLDLPEGGALEDLVVRVAPGATLVVRRGDPGIDWLEILLQGVPYLETPLDDAEVPIPVLPGSVTVRAAQLDARGRLERWIERSLTLEPGERRALVFSADAP